MAPRMRAHQGCFWVRGPAGSELGFSEWRAELGELGGPEGLQQSLGGDPRGLDLLVQKALLDEARHLRQVLELLAMVHPGGAEVGLGGVVLGLAPASEHRDRMREMQDLFAVGGLQ